MCPTDPGLKPENGVDFDCSLVTRVVSAGAHQGAVGALKFSPPGRLKHLTGTAGAIVSGGESDGVICVWAVPDGASKKEVTKPNMI